jgi:hypothetical protein
MKIPWVMRSARSAAVSDGLKGILRDVEHRVVVSWDYQVVV